jgi:hypothetical protein
MARCMYGDSFDSCLRVVLHHLFNLNAAKYQSELKSNTYRGVVSLPTSPLYGYLSKAVLCRSCLVCVGLAELVKVSCSSVLDVIYRN